MMWWTERTARVERGTSLTEYALILTGVAMVMVALVGVFNETAADLWGQAIALM